MTVTIVFTTVRWNKKFIYSVRESNLLEFGVFHGRLALQIDRSPW